MRNVKSLVDDLFVCRREQSVQGTTVYKYTAKSCSKLANVQLSPIGQSENTLDRRFMAETSSREAKSAEDCLLIVGKKKLHRLIDPAHLVDSWHRKLCSGSRNLTLIGFLAIFAFSELYFTWLLILDTQRKYRHRLDVFECLKTNKSLSPYHATPLPLRNLETEAQVKAYTNYDGSFTDSVRLFLVEFKLFYGWREVCLYLEIAHSLVFNSHSMPLYVGLYIAQYVSKSLWLIQIRSQVKDCSASLIKTFKASKSGQDYGANQSREAKNNNMRLLTLTYLNFELFRREQKAYQSLSNFLFLQMILLVLPLMVTPYLTLSVMNRDDRIIMFIFVGYTFSFFNIHPITSAIRTNMVLDLMKDMSRLVAYIAENHLETSLVARLWSSQIINYKDTLSFFAPKLLGISISFDKVVNLNAYYLLFVVFFLKA